MTQRASKRASAAERANEASSAEQANEGEARLNEQTEERKAQDPACRFYSHSAQCAMQSLTLEDAAILTYFNIQV